MELIFIYIGAFVTLIPLSAALIYKTQWDAFFKIFIGSLVLSLCVEIIAVYAYHTSEYNIHIYYIYLGLHTIMLTYMWIYLPRIKKPVPTVICIGITIFLALIYFYSQPDTRISNLMIGAIIDAIYMMLIGLWYYYGLIKNDILLKAPLKDPHFIVASCFILFCLSNIIIFGAREFLDPIEAGAIWKAKHLINGIINSGFAFAIYNYYKIRKLT